MTGGAAAHSDVLQLGGAAQDRALIVHGAQIWTSWAVPLELAWAVYGASCGRLGAWVAIGWDARGAGRATQS